MDFDLSSCCNLPPGDDCCSDLLHCIRILQTLLEIAVMGFSQIDYIATFVDFARSLNLYVDKFLGLSPHYNVLENTSAGNISVYRPFHVQNISKSMA